MDKKNYSAEELNQIDNVALRRLHNKTLMNFYEKYLEKNVYIFNLSNKDKIQLVFDKENFAHITGIQHFKPDWKGFRGWNNLSKSSFVFEDLDFNTKAKKHIINRLKNINMLPRLLKNPDLFIFESKDFPQMQFKSKYFAVMKNKDRFIKLGIGYNENNGLHYAETLLVDRDKPRYNKILDEKYRVEVQTSKLVAKQSFMINHAHKRVRELYINTCPEIAFVTKPVAKAIFKLNSSKDTIHSIDEIKGMYKKAGQRYDQDPSAYNLSEYKKFEPIVHGLRLAKKSYKDHMAKQNALGQIQKEAAITIEM